MQLKYSPAASSGHSSSGREKRGCAIGSGASLGRTLAAIRISVSKSQVEYIMGMRIKVTECDDYFKCVRAKVSASLDVQFFSSVVQTQRSCVTRTRTMKEAHIPTGGRPPSNGASVRRGQAARGQAGHLCLNCTCARFTGQFALTAEALSHVAITLWRRRGEGVQLPPRTIRWAKTTVKSQTSGDPSLAHVGKIVSCTSDPALAQSAGTLALF